ncbi:hypothetical protein HY374_03915 [Candidatus Berkelbacteria bacterium]|nr:hypothetical protein [Candidatus Berkelbacteria bacterium]
MADSTDPFYADLDHAKDEGRGSCCTWWSFLLLFGTLLLAGSMALIVLL